MRRRAFHVAALAVALVALAVWRAACVLAGPDIDTDAYAHHMIARAILADPRDLAVHWVWLPLFHYLQVPLVALGGTMDTIRWINVVAAALLPAAVFAYVARTEAEAGDEGRASTTALLAAVLAAACPIAMQMGTTAQPEPLFALLVFFAAAAFERRRYGVSAACFGAAVLFRYEAWASLAAAGAFLALDTGRALLEAPRRRPPLRPWVVVAVPAALILAWACLRRPVDGRWFGFLSQTRAFATDATHEASSLDRGLVGLAHDVVYYPVLVAARVFGPAVALVPFGVARTIRRQGPRFVAILAACLGFVSLTWVLRSSLGLDRHFVVLVPLYAVFAAQGAVAIGDAVARAVARRASTRTAERAGRVVAGALAIASVVALGFLLDRWMGFWKASVARGFPDRAAVGARLRELPDGATIFCDEATVEILSGVDRRRFDRHWLDDPQTWTLVAASARQNGVAYVATWTRKLRGHEDAQNVVYRSPGDDAEPGSGLAILRIGDGAAAAGRATR